jgi:hypothetical protein
MLAAFISTTKSDHETLSFQIKKKKKVSSRRGGEKRLSKRSHRLIIEVDELN